MANSDYVTSSKVKIRVGDVNADKPNSSAVNRKISASVNALIDASFFEINAIWDNYAIANSFSNKAPIYIPKQCQLISYCMSVGYSGITGENCLNFAVYDDSGAFVNNLFGSGANRVLINGNAKSNVVVGRDLVTATDIAINVSGVTYQYGTPNITTLEAGYYLIPMIENSVTNSKDKRISLRLREL